VINLAQESTYRRVRSRDVLSEIQFMTRTRLTAAAFAISLLAANAAVADPAGGDGDVRQACAADFQKACPEAKPGNGALKACAKAHFMSFSHPCKTALKAMRARMQSQGAGAQ
jgi:hypothetical protein